MNDCGCVNTNLCDHEKLDRHAGIAQLPPASPAADATQTIAGGVAAPADSAVAGAAVPPAAPASGEARTLMLPAMADYLAGATDGADRAARERFIGITRRSGGDS